MRSNVIYFAGNDIKKGDAVCLHPLKGVISINTTSTQLIPPNPNRITIEGPLVVADAKRSFSSNGGCPCGGVILADTEEWEVPLCDECYINILPKVGEAYKDKDWLHIHVILSVTYCPKTYKTTITHKNLLHNIIGESYDVETFHRNYVYCGLHTEVKQKQLTPDASLLTINEDCTCPSLIHGHHAGCFFKEAR